MKTEVTKNRLRKYDCSNSPGDKNLAEVEIYPKGISKLEEKLERSRDRHLFTKKEWRQLTYPKSPWYERIVATVRFANHTERVEDIGMEVISDYSCLILEPKELLNNEEIKNVINVAKFIVRTKRYGTMLGGLAYAV